MTESTPTAASIGYDERIETLRRTKLAETAEKQRVIGAMDHDDWALVLPPVDRRRLVDTVSGSGMPIKDCLLADFELEPNHPSGGAFGPRALGSNFRRLLEVHPTYVDPVSTLAGAYMVNFGSYLKPRWNPDLDYSHLRPDIERYGLVAGIGASQHFCQDLTIGLELGWRGIRENIARYRTAGADGFYAGLDDVAVGITNWISRHAHAAADLAEQLEVTDGDGKMPARQAAANLREIAKINRKLATEPPDSFREACQWILWYQLAARMYNGSGSLGRLDVILEPFYRRDLREGTLSEDEARFHLACLFARDTFYAQIGGPDAGGRDVTSRLSYLALEAAHRLRIPVNLGVAVGESTDEGLLRTGVDYLLQDRSGVPKFLGVDRTAEGFARNGYPLSLGRERAYSGCHWSAIPGREYTINDCIKINLARVFEVAFWEMMDGERTAGEPSVGELRRRFSKHLSHAVDTIRKSVDYHRRYMQHVFPELVLDLLCHGPIERGLDASAGGVEFTNIGVDAAGLATVADSFAALDQRVEREELLTWEGVASLLSADWEGGERERLAMRNIPRYGSGDSRADELAREIAKEFTELVKASPTNDGAVLVPGLFSWANTIPMGRDLGATPNGRFRGAPISHGANPDPGFSSENAPTAMALAIAAVQPGFGNAAPMQMEVDYALAAGGVNGEHERAAAAISGIIKTHFALGGTQINLNVMDGETILRAHEEPSAFPDLIVRVTGFSAYFASLSPEFRKLVVDRVLSP